jgi:hypothetical protein
MCHDTKMNFKSAGKRIIGRSYLAIFPEELDNALDLLKAILKKVRFVIIAERANLCRPTGMRVEWIDLFQ